MRFYAKLEKIAMDVSTKGLGPMVEGFERLEARILQIDERIQFIESSLESQKQNVELSQDRLYQYIHHLNERIDLSAQRTEELQLRMEQKLEEQNPDQRFETQGLSTPIRDLLQSLEGLRPRSAQPLEPLRVRALLRSLRDLAAYTEPLSGSGPTLLLELIERVEQRQEDPLRQIQGEFERCDLKAALESISQHARSAPLALDGLERTLMGIAQALWEEDQGLLQEQHPLRQALNHSLAVLDLGLILPELSTTWNPKYQKVRERRPSEAGAINRILEIKSLGFCRGELILEKASVIISDGGCP